VETCSVSAHAGDNPSRKYGASRRRHSGPASACGYRYHCRSCGCLFNRSRGCSRSRIPLRGAMLMLLRLHFSEAGRATPFRTPQGQALRALRGLDPPSLARPWLPIGFKPKSGYNADVTGSDDREFSI
jgi:hypothetical protein